MMTVRSYSSSGSSVELGTVGDAWEEVLSVRAALGGRAEEGLCSGDHAAFARSGWNRVGRCFRWVGRRGWTGRMSLCLDRSVEVR